jgi:hypothetical protein
MEAAGLILECFGEEPNEDATNAHRRISGHQDDSTVAQIRVGQEKAAHSAICGLFGGWIARHAMEDFSSFF